MEKGQIVYAISSHDIKPVEFIEETSTGFIRIKDPNSNINSLTVPYNICNTKEEAYTKLLNDLECDKQEAEETIENLEDEIDTIDKIVRKLKQKYGI